MKQGFAGFVLTLITTASVSAAVDIPGSRDLPQIDRYPLSTIELYDEVVVPEYSLATGRIKKINGVVSPETQQSLDGQLTKVTYRIPDGHSTTDVMSFLQKQIEKLNAEMLFQCSGRGCGSSNDWANRQFGIPMLYGPDREQQYLAAKLDENTYLALYVTQRGTRQVLQHAELLRSNVGQQRFAVEELMLRWQQGERVFVQPSLDDQQLAVLATAVKQVLDERPFSKLWLVGHANGRTPFLILLNDARLMADNLKKALVAKGLPENRLMIYAAGPLAPAYIDIPEQRIELLVE